MYISQLLIFIGIIILLTCIECIFTKNTEEFTVLTSSMKNYDIVEKNGHKFANPIGFETNIVSEVLSYKNEIEPVIYYTHRYIAKFYPVIVQHVLNKINGMIGDNINEDLIDWDKIKEKWHVQNIKKNPAFKTINNLFAHINHKFNASPKVLSYPDQIKEYVDDKYRVFRIPMIKHAKYDRSIYYNKEVDPELTNALEIYLIMNIKSTKIFKIGIYGLFDSKELLDAYVNKPLYISHDKVNDTMQINDKKDFADYLLKTQAMVVERCVGMNPYLTKENITPLECVINGGEWVKK